MSESLQAALSHFDRLVALIHEANASSMTNAGCSQEQVAEATTESRNLAKAARARLEAALAGCTEDELRSFRIEVAPELMADFHPAGRA